MSTTTTTTRRRSLPGALANPTPGTIVVHFNGKVQVDFSGSGPVLTPSGDRDGPTGNRQCDHGASATSLAGILGNNGIGSVKLQPQNVESFARIYAGGDGMATNGLRYGAAIEIRQNFTGQISSNGSSGASGYASLETLYVRRAFTYVAGENWGIVRIGQADGLIGIFDNGVTTFQFLPTGNLNGGDLQGYRSWQRHAHLRRSWPRRATSMTTRRRSICRRRSPGSTSASSMRRTRRTASAWAAPTTSLNGSLTGAGTGTGLSCAIANSGCPSLSSGPGIQDGARALNQTAIGVRYQGAFGGLGRAGLRRVRDQSACRLHRPDRHRRSSAPRTRPAASSTAPTTA